MTYSGGKKLNVGTREFWIHTMFVVSLGVWTVIFISLKKRGSGSKRAFSLGQSFILSCVLKKKVRWIKRLWLKHVTDGEDVFNSKWWWCIHLIRQKDNNICSYFPISMLQCGPCDLINRWRATERMCVCVDILHLSYLSCVSLKVNVLPGRNLPLVSVQVGRKELEGEVGTCGYEGLQRDREQRLHWVNYNTLLKMLLPIYCKQFHIH